MHSGAKILGIVAAVAVLSLGGSADAQRRYAGGGFAGPNELTGQIGPSFGITHVTPGGFKFDNEYGHQVSNITWFNVQLNFTLGGESHGGLCWDPHNGRYYDCWEGFSGDAIEIVAGVRLKWLRGRLMPTAKFGGGLVMSFWGGEYGATAIVFRGGGGVKYYVVRSLAVGGEAAISIGPTFIQHNGTDAYAALDLLGGIEWNF